MPDKDDELLDKIRSGVRITKDDLNNTTNDGMVSLSEGTNSYYYELSERKNGNKKDSNP